MSSTSEEVGGLPVLERLRHAVRLATGVDVAYSPPSYASNDPAQSIASSVRLDTWTFANTLRS
jgi:hypothetical protein